MHLDQLGVTWCDHESRLCNEPIESIESIEPVDVVFLPYGLGVVLSCSGDAEITVAPIQQSMN